MEMKNKGAPERDGKGKRSREMWRVRVDHGKYKKMERRKAVKTYHYFVL
jgi:hypothetical protein